MKIDESRKELLDLSFRNPLLNYRTLRARGVEIVGADPEEVFARLVTSSNRMQILPLPDDDGHPAGASLMRETESTSSNIVRRTGSNRFQTNESKSDLLRRLRNTYYFANTTIQEQGINTLFIALGMVEWYESDRSDNTRRSPVLLIPGRTFENQRSTAIFGSLYRCRDRVEPFIHRESAQ